MKKCIKCNIQYPDSQSFCSQCGSALENVKPEFEIVGKSGGKDFSEWIGIILAFVGFFVAYDFSMQFGFAINFAGFIYAHAAKNATMKWAAYILNGISALIIFLAFIAS